MTPTDAGIIVVSSIGVICILISILMMRLEHKWAKESINDMGNDRIRRNDLRHNSGLPTSVSTTLEKED
jgi:hypothetical protein